VPYHLLLVLGTIALGLWYVARTEGSRGSKYLVAGCISASLVVPLILPAAHLIGLLLQVGICAYVILYLKVASDAP
jgi:hypothetical protein